MCLWMAAPVLCVAAVSASCATIQQFLLIYAVPSHNDNENDNDTLTMKLHLSQPARLNRRLNLTHVQHALSTATITNMSVTKKYICHSWHSTSVMGAPSAATGRAAGEFAITSIASLPPAP